MQSVRDYWGLLRPRILIMVLMTVLVAAIVSADKPVPWLLVLHAVVGHGLVIMGAIALNQRIEHRTDARMERTSARPLPAGRLTTGQATRFGVLLSIAGFAYLAAALGTSALALAGASWIVYVWIYTPVKVYSPWQTPIGAVAGAMPTLLGASGVGAAFSPIAWVLFGVLYFWQFPHAMAIAWLYRGQFAAAGLRLITVTEPTGRAAAWWALSGAAVLLPISLLPTPLARAGLGYAVLAGAVGAAYLVASWRFWRGRSDASARSLLRVSFIDLLVLFVGLLMAAALR